MFSKVFVTFKNECSTIFQYYLTLFHMNNDDHLLLLIKRSKYTKSITTKTSHA